MISNYIKAKMRDISSALRYEAVTYTDGEYVSSDSNVPFKGIIVGEAGDVTIRGVDEVEVTITLEPGLYPLGGIAIVESTTTATNITTCY